jgi:hypothetical protein
LRSERPGEPDLAPAEEDAGRLWEDTRTITEAELLVFFTGDDGAGRAFVGAAELS